MRREGIVKGNADELRPRLIRKEVPSKMRRMAEAAHNIVNLDELLAEARRVVERFRSASAETQRDRSAVAELVRSFRVLEKSRKKLQNQPELRDLRLSASKAMLSLNQALRERPDVEPSNYFVDLYHFLVVVKPEPELLEAETIREDFEKAMIEARKVGLRLWEDPTFQAGLEEVPHKKKHFFERLAKVCRAHERYACVDADELPAVLAEASKFDAIAEPARQETHTKSAEARQAFLEIECSLASTPANLEECLQGASRLAELFKSGSKQLRFQVRNDLINAFKLIQKERSGSDLPCGAGLQLSRAMRVLNEALRSRAKGESGLVGRFDDLYEFHECVRFDEELFADTQIRSDLQASVREAYQIGLEILADSKNSQRLDQNPNKKGEFLSRLGEICRAHAVYDCVASSDLPAILQQGIEFFKASLKVHAEPKGEHLDFSCPRTAECQMRIGRHAGAIQTLMAVSNPGNGIKRKTAWEARSHLAECCQALGQKARLAGEDEAAQAHFQNAENWYIAAAHIWEPDLDPRSEACRSEQNRTLQGQMAWLYIDWGDPVKAETLARMFLSCVEAADENAQHTSYFLLTSSHLGTALLRQKNRNAEAIQVFEQLLAHDLPPVHRLRPLIALRQLYAWTGDTEGVRKMTQALMDACDQAADPRYASLRALTDDQQFALLDFEGMAEYVHSCNERLANGEVVSLLKELPLMVGAARVLSPYSRDDPVLLSLLGQADFQVGNFKAALDTFSYVLKLDQSPKNHGITWMLIGNVHLAEGKLDDALTAYTTSHESGGREIAPLLKAASVCRLKRDYDRALRLLDTIERTGRDDRPFVTKTVRARTLWSRFQETANEAEGRAACGELLEVIERSEHRDSVAVRYLTQMLSHPLAQSFLSEILETTTDLRLVLEIRQWLAKQPDIPQPILAAVFRRLANRTTQVGSDKAFVGVLALAIVRGYFVGSVGGMSFDQFAADVCRLFLGQDPDTRRAWLLELLTAEREAPSAELMRRYADKALGLLAPVLSGSGDAHERICSSGLLDSLVSFLKDEIPEDVCPAAYANGDRTDLRRELEALVEAKSDELAEEIERGCRIQVTSQPERPVWGCWFRWMKARRFLAKLLGIADGPLRDLASETAVWSADVSLEADVLEIAFSFDPIDPLRNPPQVMARTQEALREWQRQAAPAAEVSWREPENWEQTRRMTIRVAVNPPRFWPRGFAPFGKFAAYLADESWRILSGQGTDTGFFQKADEMFPPAHAAAFHAPPSDWVLFLRCVLDQQFALTVDWLMSLARHPRAVIHDLKREVQMLVAGKEAGRACCCGYRA